MKSKLVSLILSGVFLASCASTDSIVRGSPLEFSCIDLSNPPSSNKGYSALSGKGARSSYKKRHSSFLFKALQAYSANPNQQQVGDAPFKNIRNVVGTAARDEFASLLNARAPEQDNAEQSILVLSGGGQWGAFGAGFLSDPRNRQIGRDSRPIEWDFVTGISTGALQALFVGAEDYGGMAKSFTLLSDSELATKNGLWGVLRKGSINDTSRLRSVLIARLLNDYDRETGQILGAGLLERIAKRDLPEDKRKSVRRPHIFIGVVEAKSGHFFEIDITRLVTDHYPKAGEKDFEEKRKKLAECVAGWALASSAVPVQLSPVAIIEGSTDKSEDRKKSVYFDGGVRNSTFITTSIIEQELRFAARYLVVEQLNAACNKNDAHRNPICIRSRERYSKFNIPAPHIYVIRNGPTIVPDDGLMDKVDENPSVWNTGLRGYATLVNQNELTSISTLLLQFPRRPLNYVSADGYNWYDAPQEDCKQAKRNPDVYFDKRFMDCLRQWGQRHADEPAPSGWRQIRNPSVCPAPQNDRNDPEENFCVEGPTGSVRELLEPLVSSPANELRINQVVR